MYRYRPRSQPDPAMWLSLDEQDQINLVAAFHRSERIHLPNETVHATFHVCVENQIAQEHDPVIRAMQRPASEGLSRHGCLYAVGWALPQALYNDAQDTRAEPGKDDTDLQSQYDSALERLSAASWRAQASGSET